MELTVTHEEGYVLAVTEGPIDDSAEALFRKHLHPLVGRAGGKLVLDLSKSNFISSSGLGQLVSLAVHANTNGSKVVLAACSPFIAVVFQRSKLNLFLETANSVADAARMLN